MASKRGSAGSAQLMVFVEPAQSRDGPSVCFCWVGVLLEDWIQDSSPKIGGSARGLGLMPDSHHEGLTEGGSRFGRANPSEPRSCLDRDC